MTATIARTAAPTPVTETKKLRDTVELLDALSQEGFTEISAVAKLTIKSLDTPNGHRHLEDVVYALKAIWNKADEIQNLIGSNAEQVGCSYVDDSMDKFWNARRRAENEQQQGGAV